jgi:hypothetical protein
MESRKVEIFLKHHGWVMGHGWGLHGGTWKMGGWGQNIALEMLHVFRWEMFWGLRLLRHQNTCRVAH